MAVKDGDTLKSYFTLGKVPTPSQYVDLIDTIIAGGGGGGSGQYVHLYSNDSIRATHTFNPYSLGAPFLIGPNGADQEILGLFAEHAEMADGATTALNLSRSVIAGNGLSGGGMLSGQDVTLSVGAGSGISIDADSVSIDLATVSGLMLNNGLMINDTIAGAGLTITTKVLAVGQGDGITVSADSVNLKTPGTLSVSSVNDATNNHTHAITTSADPGATAQILASDTNGYLHLLVLYTDKIDNKSASTNLEIRSRGDIVFDPVGNDVLPATNYLVNLGMINKKYLTLHAAELWVETLVAQDTMATIGGRILIAPTTILTRDVTDQVGDSVIHVKHNQMTTRDIVYLESDGKIEWMMINDAGTPDGDGGYVYNVNRNLDGSGRNNWYAGDAVLNTGQVGNGYIDIYSIDSIRSGVQYGPTIVGNIRTSITNYYDLIEAWAIGNLNGLYGYSVDTYGAAFGEYLSGKSFITIEPTNGIRFLSKVGTVDTIQSQWTLDGTIILGEVGNTKSRVELSAGALEFISRSGLGSDVIKMSLIADGTVTIGGTGTEHIIIDSTSLKFLNGATTYAELNSSTWTLGLTTGPNTVISSAGIQLKNSSTIRVEVTSAGYLYIRDSGGSAVFTFNSSSGAEFTKPLTLATTGGIYQGTGTFASPTTGLKIYNSGGYGKISGYNAGVEQWYANTDGKLYAGGGSVYLDGEGISLTPPSSYDPYAAIKWKDGSTVTTYITGLHSVGILNTLLILVPSIAGYESHLTMGTAAPAGSLSDVNLSAVSGSSMIQLILNGMNSRVEIDQKLTIGVGLHVGDQSGTCYTDDVIVDGGIMVGRTADPTAGDIHYTGDLNSYKNSTSYTGYIYVPLAIPLINSTYWEAKTFSTVSTSTQIVMTSAVTGFGVPANCKGYNIQLIAKDSSGNITNSFSVGPSSTYWYQGSVRPSVSNALIDNNLIVNCDANGSIWYRCVASGTLTLTVYLRVWGYFI